MAVFLSILNCSIKNLFFQHKYVDVISHVGHYIEFARKATTNLPRAELSTFYYYLGRISIYDERYQEAEEELAKALQFCDPQHERNLSYIVHW